MKRSSVTRMSSCIIRSLRYHVIGGEDVAKLLISLDIRSMRLYAWTQWSSWLICLLRNSEWAGPILNFPFPVSTFEILHLLKGMLWFFLSMILMWEGNYEIVNSVISIIYKRHSFKQIKLACRRQTVYRCCSRRYTDLTAWVPNQRPAAGFVNYVYRINITQ